MFIYILKLEKGKYYVGRSANPYPRIEAHKHQLAKCAWTNKYRYEKTIDIIETDDSFDEDKWTKKYMKQNGINNVRGGSYTKIILCPNTITFIEQEIRGATDACYKCGKGGHFVKECLSDVLRDSYKQTYTQATQYESDDNTGINIVDADIIVDSICENAEATQYESDDTGIVDSICENAEATQYESDDTGIVDDADIDDEQPDIDPKECRSAFYMTVSNGDLVSKKRLICII